MKRSYPKYVRLRQSSSIGTVSPNFSSSIHILAHDHTTMYGYTDKTKCGVLVNGADQFLYHVPMEGEFCKTCLERGN